MTKKSPKDAVKENNNKTKHFNTNKKKMNYLLRLSAEFNKGQNESHDIKTFECKNCKKFYKNSSSYDKHIRWVHGEKWKCSYCGKTYSDKNSHQVYSVKDNIFKKKFFQSYIDINDPIQFINRKNNMVFKKNSLEKGPFIYFTNNLLGNGHFSKCYYAIDTVSGKEVAIKFALNKNKIIDYKREGLILNKLNNKNFFPKLYNFNFDSNSGFLGMTLMDTYLLKISNFCGESFFNKKLLKILELV